MFSNVCISYGNAFKQLFLPFAVLQFQVHRTISNSDVCYPLALSNMMANVDNLISDIIQPTNCTHHPYPSIRNQCDQRQPDHTLHSTTFALIYSTDNDEHCASIRTFRMGCDINNMLGLFVCVIVSRKYLLQGEETNFRHLACAMCCKLDKD